MMEQVSSSDIDKKNDLQPNESSREFVSIDVRVRDNGLHIYIVSFSLPIFILLMI